MAQFEEAAGFGRRQARFEERRRTADLGDHRLRADPLGPGVGGGAGRGGGLVCRVGVGLRWGLDGAGNRGAGGVLGRVGGWLGGSAGGG
jgi:hypothetical protein